MPTTFNTPVCLPLNLLRCRSNWDPLLVTPEPLGGPMRGLLMLVSTVSIQVITVTSLSQILLLRMFPGYLSCNVWTACFAFFEAELWLLFSRFPTNILWLERNVATSLYKNIAMAHLFGSSSSTVILVDLYGEFRSRETWKSHFYWKNQSIRYNLVKMACRTLTNW